MGDLVLSQEDQKGIGQLVRFRRKLPFFIQVIIIIKERFNVAFSK